MILNSKNTGFGISIKLVTNKFVTYYYSIVNTSKYNKYK